MAIDPTIALNVKTPPLPDPLEQAGRAVQIKNQIQAARQSAAESAQSLQEGAQKIQTNQIGLDQAAAINKAYQDNFTVDPATGKSSLDTEGLSKALAVGGHGSAIPGIIEATTKAHKAMADLAETQGKVLDQQTLAAGSVGAAVREAKYDPHLFLTLMQNGINQKSVDPSLAAPIVAHIQQLLAADPTGATATPEVQAAADHMIAASPKQRELDTAAATAAARQKTADTGAQTANIKQPGEQAAADQLETLAAAQKLRGAPDRATYEQILGTLKPAIAMQFQSPARFDPEKTPAFNDRAAMTPEQRTQADQAAANAARETARNAEQAANEQELRRQGNVRNSIEGGRLKMEQAAAGYGAAPGTVTPAAQMAADGRMDPATLRAMMRKNPGLISQIQQVDPKFDEANIDNRYNTLKEFSSSSNTKAGGQVIALNTLIHHADLYQQVGEALKNGSFTPGNAAYNAVSALLGSPAPQNAALVARFLAGETGKVATGGVPAEGEINGILKSLSTSSSPQQISDAGKTLLQIAAGRATPLMEKAKQAKIDTIVPVIGPDAKEILARRGYDPATLKPANSAGGGVSLSTGHKVGDVVSVGGGKKVKITKLLPGDKFEGDLQ